MAVVLLTMILIIAFAAGVNFFGRALSLERRKVEELEEKVTALDIDLDRAVESLSRIRDDLTEDPAKDAETTLLLLHTTTNQINK